MPPAECRCPPPPAPPPPKAQLVRLRIERKGRGGKVVTVVEGIAGPPALLEETARALKEACGTGGTVKQGTIELQGDHRTRAAAALATRGYRVKN